MRFFFWPGPRSWKRVRTYLRERARGTMLVAAAATIVLVSSVLAASAANGSGAQPYDTYESAVGSDSPAAQYRFDESAGATTLEDSAGSLDASVSGVTTGAAGPFGGARAGAFGGSGVVSMPGTPFSTATAFTVEAWIDWSDGTSYDEHVFDLGSSPDSHLFLTPASSASGHPLRFEIVSQGNPPFDVDAPTLGAGVWHDVAVTEDGSGTVTLYVDGSEVATRDGVTVSPATLGATVDNWLGKSQNAGDPLFDGSLSNVAFYTRALSAAQVLAHWDAAEFPVATSDPQLSGTPTDGERLSTTDGEWTGIPPIGFSYRWQRCDPSGGNCQPIPGATEPHYTLTSPDVGSRVEAQVTGTNGAGNSTATSAPSDTIVGVAPSNDSAPSLSGTARDGATLSADEGAWSGSTPISYAYQWQRCDSSGASCTDIQGATGSTYQLGSADVGATVRVVVSAQNMAGSANAPSPASDVVAGVAPSNSSPPSISGTTQDGQTLNADHGSWDGTTPLSYSYQWRRCDSAGANCSDIAGATGSGYALASADIGSTVRVVVTATNPVGSATASSSATDPVAPAAPTNTQPPAISGSAEQGQTLTASQGSWSGTSPMSFSYQWRRCDGSGASCADIAGATDSAYTLRSADVGNELRVTVTTTNVGGSTSSTTATTGVVIPTAAGNCTNTWNGRAGDGIWETAGNWSAGRVPDSTDRACVAQGTAIGIPAGAQAGSLGGGADITINGGDRSSLYLTDSSTPSTVESLIQRGSTVGGPSTLTITGSLREQSGAGWNFLWGPGTTVLAPGATGSIDSGTFFIGSRTLRNEGTLSFVGAQVNDQDAATIDNTGTLVFDGTTSFSHYSGSPSLIRNSGLLVKDSGSGTSTVGLPIDNEATVDAQSGTLSFTAGGGQNQPGSGTWRAEPSATVDLHSGSFSLGQSAAFDGHVQIDSAVTAGSVHGGSVDLAGGDPASLSLTDTTTGSTVDSLTQRGGTIAGAGTLTVSGTLHEAPPANGSAWNFQDGPGTTVLGPDATGTIDGGTFFIDGRTVRNQGALTYTSGQIYDADAALIDNSGTLTLNGENAISHYSGNPSSIRNSGLLRKTAGTGTTRVPLTIENDSGGTIDAQSGTLAFTNGGGRSDTAGGTWQAESPATVDFSTGNFLIGQTAQFGGNIQIDAAVTAGSVDGSTAHVTMAGSDNAFLVLTDAQNSSSIKTLTQHGGTIAGDGTLTINDTMDISAVPGRWAFQRGPGKTVIAPSATGEINTGIFFLSARTLRNEGELDYNGGQVFDENHPIIDNVGKLSFPGTGEVFSHYGGALGEIDNSGTIEKPEGSSGSTQINLPIHNDALVEADAGQLGIDPGTLDCIATPPLTEPGTWVAVGHGELGLNKPNACETFGTLHAFNGGRIDVINGTSVGVNNIDASNGTIDIASGSLNVYDTSNIGDLIIGPQGTLTGTGEVDACPTLDWLGGTMSGQGETDLCSSGSGTIDPGSGGQVNLDERVFVNHGDLSWREGSVAGANGGLLSNWGVLHANSESGAMQSSSQGDPAVLINHSTLEKDQGAGTTQVCYLVINRGTVTSQTGTLQFCPQFNGSTEENADPEASDCTLKATGSDLEDTDGDGIPEIYVGFSVDCNPPVPVSVTVSVEDEIAGEKECSAEQNPCSDIAHWEGLPPENQNCVYWLVEANIPDAKQPNPGVTGASCRPGTTEP